MDMLSPVLEVLGRPVSSVHEARGAVTDHFGAVEENRRLKIENDRLRHWQSAALALKAENDALRQLANYHAQEQSSFVTARVVGQSPSVYSQTLIINVGAADGVKSLQPVVDSYGLIGRLTDVGEHTSQVLLLSDASSRVPVITKGVVTTMEGNLIPGGLAIGQVFRSDKTGFSVKPMRPLTQTEYVRVMTQ